MASLTTHTVLREVSTRSGIGKYCNAVREAIVVDGGAGMLIERESLLLNELGECAEPRRLKYPSSRPSFSAMMQTGNAEIEVVEIAEVRPAMSQKSLPPSVTVVLLATTSAVKRLQPPIRPQVEYCLEFLSWRADFALQPLS